MRSGPWLNEKGSWITNLIALICLKVVFSVIPGITTELSWTLTNVVYNVSTFIMFHGVSGVPFEFSQGEYQDLTLWEQMDNGAEFTPAKKYLTTVPVILFLVACHYARLDLPIESSRYNETFRMML
ncbi:ORMDL family [Hyaloraphidium curvatum]|nr:ORMDL family [Hyaloraphidium curvatum]